MAAVVCSILSKHQGPKTGRAEQSGPSHSARAARILHDRQCHTPGDTGSDRQRQTMYTGSVWRNHVRLTGAS